MDDQRTDRTSGGIRFRKLRIAFSVVCGVACVLLIALWVRSYKKPLNFDVFGCFAHSTQGVVLVQRIKPDGQCDDEGKQWMSIAEKMESKPVAGVLGFAGNFYYTSLWTLQVPYWFVVSIFVVIGSAPVAKVFGWRFSLRTLLIATTLVAAALGLAVYALRK